MKVLPRRTVLRGAGGVAIALPFLEAMRPRKAAAQTRRYFVPVFTPNGIIPQRWASGTENNFVLGTILQALEPHRNNIVVLHGIYKNAGPRGDNHEKGIGALLTGRELNTGPFPVGGANSTVGWANGISVDQFIVGEIAKTTTTKFRSLELAVQAGNGVWDRMCYAAPDKPIAPETSPYAAFDRLFADLNVNPADLARIRAQRKSVMDTVLGQFAYMSGKLGTADRQRLDAHEAAIRDLETSLGVQSKGLQSCGRPVLGAMVDPRANDNFPAIGKLMMDVLVMAITCDLTRVASLQWSRAAGDVRFTWLGITDGHHTLSHRQAGVKATDPYQPTAANESLLKIDTWYGQQFAYLVNRLKSVTDGSETLLDSTVVMWGSEISNGYHDLDNLPYVLAGGGWGVRMGRYMKFDQKTSLHNALLVSALNAMGISGTTFGNPMWGSGPLPGLK